MSADSAREQLKSLINEIAVVRGAVTLSSGAQANYYLDLRRITLDHRSAPLVGQVMLDLIDSAGLGGVDAVGGLTMGADPVATAVLHQSVARGVPVDAFVVRKEAKTHGLARRIEGANVEGRRVVALEDTSTTGGSVLQAVAALREAGAHVVAVAVIVDRDTGSRERVEAEGLPYLTAYGAADLAVD